MRAVLRWYSSMLSFPGLAAGLYGVPSSVINTTIGSSKTLPSFRVIEGVIDRVPIIMIMGST
ncbi:MAG: hypothetical protein IKI93_15015, partial [Clostridia bacterium]|nr:hypothetical protein [Clostridia bacterium]